MACFISDYITEIYESMQQAIEEGKLVAEMANLKELEPQPISSVVKKEECILAVEKHWEQYKMSVDAVSATGSDAQEHHISKNQRKAPHYALCEQPMKGQKYVACPRNAKK